jgi:hypothetical protein
MMKTLTRVRPQILLHTMRLYFFRNLWPVKSLLLVVECIGNYLSLFCVCAFLFRTHLHDTYSVQYRYFRCGGVLNWRVHAEHIVRFIQEHVTMMEPSSRYGSLPFCHQAALASVLVPCPRPEVLSTIDIQRKSSKKQHQHQHDARRCGSRAGSS